MGAGLPTTGALGGVLPPLLAPRTPRPGGGRGRAGVEGAAAGGVEGAEVVRLPANSI